MIDYAYKDSNSIINYLRRNTRAVEEKDAVIKQLIRDKRKLEKVKNNICRRLENDIYLCDKSIKAQRQIIWSA